MTGRIREVVSNANPLYKQLKRMVSDPAAYRKTGQAWLEGDHLCRSLRARGRLPLEAVISASAWQQPLWRELAEGVPIVSVMSDDLMVSLSSLESPAPGGFLIQVPVGESAAPLSGVPSVILDRLQDAGNVGSILRSASALGVRQVIALKGTAALWSTKVLRAGMGAHFGLHLVEGAGEGDLLTLQVPLIATSSYAARSLPDTACAQPCAWVLGHEGRGVSDALLSRCAATVRIPQPGGEESLNVAAAAAICLYESARQSGSRWCTGSLMPRSER